MKNIFITSLFILLYSNRLEHNLYYMCRLMNYWCHELIVSIGNFVREPLSAIDERM